MRDIWTIKHPLDHILVGQGLAGSCLAMELIKRGKKILVFDQEQKNRASAVAAGLFNPITGKLMKQSWMAEKLFPSLFQFYKDAEDLLQQNFFHSMPIYRPFLSIEEQNEWMAESEKKLMQYFIAKIHTSSAFSQVHDPFGGVITKHSGFLDTVAFMTAVRDFLRNKKVYHEAFFSPEKLTIRQDKIHYEGLEARNIIFCEGVHSKTNPFFSWAPIRSLKGETLTVHLTGNPEVIFNRGVYVVPTKTENVYRVGATYHPGDVSEEISGAARKALEEKLAELMKIPFTINHQNWGMRPTTPDRRPLLGPHPEFKNVIIFNGLGTKGVSLAPYYSGVLADWFERPGEIPFDVNIERFKSLYSKLVL